MKLSNQSRWNSYGQSPDASRFVPIDNPLIPYPQLDRMFSRYFGNVKGKKILDLGCGKGLMSAYLAKQGAHVVGVDIGSDLVAFANQVAHGNNVRCKFITTSANKLPLPDEHFDSVIVLGVLHHLPEEDIAPTIQEIYRVLKDGGICFIHESIEDSSVFDYIQNIIPLRSSRFGEGRPSILSRKKWKQYQQALDQRPLKTTQLLSHTKDFELTNIAHLGLLSRLERIIPSLSKLFNRLDLCLLKIRYLRRYSQSIVLVIKKPKTHKNAKQFIKKRSKNGKN